MLDRFVSKIRENDDRLSAELAREIIKEHKPYADYAKELYARFRFDSEALPIMNRKPPDTQTKVDQRVANDWFGEIVNTKIGYTYSLPVGIGYEPFEDNVDSQTVESIKRYIDRFNNLNDFDKMSPDIGRYSSIMGYDAILCYLANGVERVMRLDPWEVVFITDTTLHEPPYSMRYYQDGKVTHIEFYTNEYRILYELVGNVITVIEEDIHEFELNPLFGMANNDELQSDAHKVIPAIDAYDGAVSDFSSEVAQFRLAYLVFMGVKPTPQMIEQMITTGAIYVPPNDQGSSQNNVTFLQKQINDAAVTSLLDRLESNITRFARHVNFTEAAFGSDISSPAMRWKLFMLEQKAAESVINHRAALRRMYAVLATSWRKRMKDIFGNFDAMDLEFSYRRNIPANDKDAVETAVAMLGLTSRMAALEYLKSIIPNAPKEYQRWLNENQGNEDYVLDDELPEDEMIDSGDGNNNETGVANEKDLTNEV